VRRPDFTSSNGGQNIALNDLFELPRQGFGRRIDQILDPLLHEGFKLQSLPGRIPTPNPSAIELFDLPYRGR
jgi:hypothetical protein